MGNPFRVHLPLSTIASGTMQPFPPSLFLLPSFPNRSRPRRRSRPRPLGRSINANKCVSPGTRLSARLPSCVHGLVSVPRLKPKAENEDEHDWGRKQASRNPVRKRSRLL
jgi:hypothetical protein